jgi:hypothetical protein
MTDDTTTGRVLRPPAAWDNPAWVQSLMYHPNRPDLLESVRLKGEMAPEDPPFPSMEEAYYREQYTALRAGWTAGAVLALLYALSRAGWELPGKRKPSRRLAIACIARFGEESGNTLDEEALERAPISMRIAVETLQMYTSRGKVRKCFEKYAGVAHLWAAVRLHQYGLMQDAVAYDGARLAGLFTTRAGFRVLLATARPVQEFARSYRDPNKGEPIDFGPSPWWVPDGLQLRPAWHSVAPRELLLKFIRDYSTKD